MLVSKLEKSLLPKIVFFIIFFINTYLSYQPMLLNFLMYMGQRENGQFYHKIVIHIVQQSNFFVKAYIDFRWTFYVNLQTLLRFATSLGLHEHLNQYLFAFTLSVLTVWSMSCRDRWNTITYFPYTQPGDFCILHLNVVVIPNLFGKL